MFLGSFRVNPIGSDLTLSEKSESKQAISEQKKSFILVIVVCIVFIIFPCILLCL